MDWLEIDDIRFLYPGIDPMRNSHRRNMALLKRGSKRGTPESISDTEMEQRKEIRERWFRGELE